ncbi:MAG: segregation/condensation protein A [Bacillota bacterium]
MPINIKLQAFEGPLDLLLHLIEKAEVDIYDIPIADIAEQYLDYLHMMQQFDIEVASEFLVMAATLLEIKSKMLLPKPKKENNQAEEIDPREELVQKLIEYKKYKEFSETLKDKLVVYEKVFYKHPEPIENYIPDYTSLNGITLDMLTSSLEAILLRSIKRRKNSIREIYRDAITIEDKILSISKLLTAKPAFYFEDLFSEYISRYEIIVTFMAVLELIKQKNIHVEQDKSFGKILIKRRVD